MAEGAFPYKTTPFEHQRVALRRSALKKVYALLMEQGTGKTKVIIDTAAYQYIQGNINLLYIVAPNGVHLNWINDELPAHLPECIPSMSVAWESSKADNVGFRDQMERLLAFNGLAIFAMNVEALITKKGKLAACVLLGRRKGLMVIDESIDIKTPSAKRTRAAWDLGKFARMRRILNGTPGDPLAYYSQFRFLDPDILRTKSFTAFKGEYAIMEERDFNRHADKIVYSCTMCSFASTRVNDPLTCPMCGNMSLMTSGSDDAGKRPPIKVIVGYKNEDRLRALIEPFSFRVLKDDVLDLPPKMFSKWYFSLSREQQTIYRQLLRGFQAELSTGETVTVTNVLTRYLRLQQIICGFVPVDCQINPFDFDKVDPQPVKMLPGPNPRLEAMKEIREKHPGKMIIWTRFIMDVDLLMKELTAMGHKCVRYDGNVKRAEDREKAKHDFQNGDADTFIGNPQAGGRGLTLHAARTVVFYANYFGLITRLQAEDRAHRIGLDHSVLYIDLLAPNTVDERIISSLRSHRNVADSITGDPKKDWI